MDVARIETGLPNLQAQPLRGRLLCNVHHEVNSSLFCGVRHLVKHQVVYLQAASFQHHCSGGGDDHVQEAAHLKHTRAAVIRILSRWAATKR